MLLSKALPLFEKWLSAQQNPRNGRKLSPSTIESYLSLNRTYIRYLETIAPNPKLADFNPLSAQAFALTYGESESKGTGRKRSASAQALAVAALKKFGLFLTHQAWASENPAAEVLAPSVPKPNLRPMTAAEVDAAIDACSRLRHPEQQARGRALFTLLAFTGVRISSALGIHDEDIRWQERTIFLRVVKGGGTHTVPFGNRVEAALREYWKLRPNDLPYPHFFWIDRKTPLTYTRARNVLQELKRLAGPMHDDRGRVITEKDRAHWTLHAFRHFTGSNALRNGADLRDLRDLYGHTSIATTDRYLQSDSQSMRRVADAAERTRDRENPRPVSDTERGHEETHRRKVLLRRRA